MAVARSSLVLRLPVNSFTCKFHRATFTAEIHYLQIQLLANSHSPQLRRRRVGLNTVADDHSFYHSATLPSSFQHTPKNCLSI